MCHLALVLRRAVTNLLNTQDPVSPTDITRTYDYRVVDALNATLPLGDLTQRLADSVLHIRDDSGLLTDLSRHALNLIEALC